jgi:hypothetical protein
VKVGDLVRFKHPTKKEAGKVHLVLSIEPIYGLKTHQVKLVHVDIINNRDPDFGWYPNSDLEVVQSHN